MEEKYCVCAFRYTQPKKKYTRVLCQLCHFTLSPTLQEKFINFALGKAVGLQNKVIGISGMIGVGKSTFLEEIKQIINDKTSDSGEQICEIFPEIVNQDMLKLYLNNPNVYASHFQQYKMQIAQTQVDRAHEWVNSGNKRIAFVERTPVENILFVIANKSKISPEYRLFYDMIFRDIHNPPDIIINLKADPDVLIERIKKRNRPGEVEAYIEKHEYFVHLYDLYEKYSNICDPYIYNFDWNTRTTDFSILEEISTINKYYKPVSDLLLKLL